MAALSFAQILSHNAILFINTSTMAWHNKGHWLVGRPYLPIMASNVLNEHSLKFTNKDYLR